MVFFPLIRTEKPTCSYIHLNTLACIGDTLAALRPENCCCWIYMGYATRTHTRAHTLSHVRTPNERTKLEHCSVRVECRILLLALRDMQNTHERTLDARTHARMHKRSHYWGWSLHDDTTEFRDSGVATTAAAAVWRRKDGEQAAGATTSGDVGSTASTEGSRTL